MANRWFRVPTKTIKQTDDSGNVISSTDGPMYRDLDGITGFSGNTIGNSPQWVIRFYGDSATLDMIASKSDATELSSSEAAQQLSNAGVDHLSNDGWDATSVNERFRVG